MKRILIFALLSLIMITSCEKRNDAFPKQKETIDLRFTVGTQQKDSTKVAVDNLTFSWTAGDKVTVYGYNTRAGRKYDKSAEFTLSSEAGNNYGDFEGTFTPEPTIGSKIYASYGEVGSVEKNNRKLSIKFNQPVAQVQKHNGSGELLASSIGEYSYMFGKSDKTYNSSMGNEFSINMNNLMSIIDFNLTGFAPKGRIKNLSVTSDAFSESVQVDLDSQEVTNSETCVSGVSVQLLDNKAASDVVRMAILPQTVAENTIWTVKIETEDGVYSVDKTFKKAKTFASGLRYSLAIDFNDMSSDSDAFVSKQSCGYYTGLSGSLVDEFLYVAGSAQTSLLVKGNKYRFAMISESGNKFFSLVDLPKALVVDQSYNVELVSKNISLTNKTTELKVVKIDGDKVWLATPDNTKGFIINKAE